MTISQQGLDLIKQFEGLRLKAYRDGAGIWTIGYGTTRYENGKKVQPTDVITNHRAEELLRSDCRVFCVAVNAVLSGTSINQNQFDALVSLCYNIGSSAFRGSSVVKNILSGQSELTISASWVAWNKITVDGKKVVSEGLTNRRIAEIKHYYSK